MFTRYTNRNQFNILLTADADVRKGQTDMQYKGSSTKVASANLATGEFQRQQGH